jgi:hypothetical protein
MEHLEQQLKKVLNAILVQSHINYLQSEIERLAGETRIRGSQPYLWKMGEESYFPMTDFRHEEALKICGYNTSIYDQISHLKKQIINANKLLK